MGDHQEKVQISTYFSHLSRLFVSAMATFFVLFSIFIVLAFGNQYTDGPRFFLAGVTWVFALIFIQRANLFRKAIEKLEDDLKINGKCPKQWWLEDLFPKE